MVRSDSAEEVARKHGELVRFIKSEQDAGREVTFTILRDRLAMTQQGRKKRLELKTQGVPYSSEWRPYEDKRQLQQALDACRKCGILRLEKEKGVWTILGKGWLHSYRNLLLEMIEMSPIDRAEFSGNVSLFGFPVSDMSQETRGEYDRILSEISQLGDELFLLRAKVICEKCCADLGDDKASIQLQGRQLMRLFEKDAQKKLSNHGCSNEDIERVAKGMVDELPSESRAMLDELSLCDGEDVDQDSYEKVRKLMEGFPKESNIPIVVAVAPEIQQSTTALMKSLWRD